MSNFNKNLPGVVADSLSEQAIDTIISPVGQGEPPAGIVGTAARGPAFVPFDVGGNKDFETVFGEIRNSVSEKHFGALGANSYFNAGGDSVVYVRTLGAGDCKPRVEGDNAGRVNNAGFVVGSEIVNTGTNLIGPNTYAGSQTGAGTAASVTITASNGPTSGKQITIVTTDGTSKTFQADSSTDGTASTALFNRNGANHGLADLKAAIEASSIAAKVTVGSPAGSNPFTLTITQTVAGAAGNTTISSNADNYTIGTGGESAADGAFTGGLDAPAGALGRAYFLTAFMSQSADSTIFSDSGLQTLGESKAAHIIRGMLFAPSGVVLSLSSNLEPNNTPVSDTVAYSSFGTSLNAGCNIGTLNTTNGGQTFVLFMNGHKSTADHPNAITASLNPLATFQDVKESLLGDEDDLPVNVSSNDSLYFGNIFNTDPTKIQEAGHYLYTHYDIFPLEARANGSGIIADTEGYGVHEPLVMLLTSSLSRNTGSTTSTAAGTVGVPNFENFEDRFTNAFSPFIVSQLINRKRKNLFRFHSFTDGDVAEENLRIVISNIQPGENERGYTKFKVELFLQSASELAPPVFTFEECDLDPSSENFIARIVGDTHAFYDFDQAAASQKLVIDGTQPLKNRFVRVEVAKEVSDGVMPKNAIPAGFRGIYHLVTSGSATGGPILTGSVSANAQRGHEDGLPNISTIDIKSVVQPPLPMRDRISIGVPGDEVLTVVSDITWGAQYSRKDTVKNPNLKKGSMTSFVPNLTKFMPSFHTTLQNPWVGDNQGLPDAGGCVLDADRFNRNLFTLENIVVITGTIDGTDGAELPPHPNEWAASIYARNEKVPPTLFKSTPQADDVGKSDKIRFVDLERDLKDLNSRSFLKFTVPMHSAFDGLNFFDAEAKKMSDVRVYRERLDPKLSNKTASTTSAYVKGVEILSEKSNSDMQLLVTPGIKHRNVTDRAVTLAEDKFNVLYVADVEPYDVSGSYVTSSLQPPGIKQLSDKFSQRALASSFATFYYPEITIDYGTNVPVEDPPIPPIQVPASVGALAAIAINDADFGVGSAPMGGKRAPIARAISVSQGFTDKERERMMDSAINVFTGGINAAGTIFPTSQKTSLNSDSSLSRVNVRRLVIDIRRRSRDISRNFLMQPNTARTRASLKNALKSMLAGFVTSGAITEFRVDIADPNHRPPPVERGPADLTVNAMNEIKMNLDKFKPFGNLLNRQGSSLQELSTIRGSIFLKPAQSDEMVKLDIDETTEE